MKRTNHHFNGFRNEPAIPEGHEIALYKKGSYGEVVGRYQSIDDVVDCEKMFNGSFSAVSVLNCLIGKRKSFTSFNHQCRVIAKVVRRFDNEIYETQSC